CIFDLYCIPSHFDFAYYVRIYRVSDSYKAIYARTEISGIFGNKIYCCPFSETLKAKKHSGKSGKIICGYFMPSESFIIRLSALSEFFPEKDFISDSRNTILDGVWQVIRMWKNGRPFRTVSFESMSAYDLFGKEFADIVCDIYKLTESEIKHN
ncbi:MAG: hypothetical protein K2J44_05060, partial [Ruminococcus sp.]|nr:hypothetical protein [Ruminococcus sp.]